MKIKSICITIIVAIILLNFVVMVSVLNENKNLKEENSSSNNLEKEEISVTYKNIDFISNILTTDYEIYDNKIVYIDKKIYDLDGKLIFDGSKYNDVKYESNHIKADNIIYDLNGKLIFDGSKYDNVDYYEKYVLVEKNKKIGLVDKNNNIILSIEYDSATVKSDNCISLGKNNKNGAELGYVYNTKSNKIYGPYAYLVSYFSDKIIIAEKYLGDYEELEPYSGINNNKLATYIIDLIEEKEFEKRELDNYRFITAKLFEDYLITIEFVDWVGYKYGVLDKEYKVFIPFEYDKIDIIADKYFLLKKNNKYELRRKDNKKILEFDEEYDIDVEDGLITLEKVETYEYYDLNGNLIYETKDDKYSYVTYIGDNKYLIEETDYENYEKCIYMDASKKEDNKKEINYSFCDNNYGEEYLISDVENVKELYNNKLERVFENKYEYINIQKNYCIVMNENDKYALLSYKEEKLVEEEFDDYELNENNSVILYNGPSYNPESIYYFNYD